MDQYAGRLLSYILTFVVVLVVCCGARAGEQVLALDPHKEEGLRVVHLTV